MLMLTEGNIALKISTYNDCFISTRHFSFAIKETWKSHHHYFPFFCSFQLIYNAFKQQKKGKESHGETAQNKLVYLQFMAITNVGMYLNIHIYFFLFFFFFLHENWTVKEQSHVITSINITELQFTFFVCCDSYCNCWLKAIIECTSMESEKNGPQNAIAVCQLSFFFRIFIHLAGSSLSNCTK